MKDGRRYAARQVEAWQGGECIFQLSAGFHLGEQGPDHQPTMPEAPAPEDCPNRDRLRGRDYWQDMPVDVRMVTEITADAPLPAEQMLWMRANGALPEDPGIHLALLVYASDRCLLDTAFRPHADTGEMVGASLDHSMWFHAAPRFDDWVLYHTTSPVAAQGRGLATGFLYDRHGRCLASVAQEGSVRFR